MDISTLEMVQYARLALFILAGILGALFLFHAKDL